VGGIDYPAGTHQPALRHVTDLGADGLFIEGARAPAARPDVVVVSAQPCPSVAVVAPVPPGPGLRCPRGVTAAGAALPSVMAPRPD
jgi:hypothetical protein